MEEFPSKIITAWRRNRKYFRRVRSCEMGIESIRVSEFISLSESILLLELQLQRFLHPNNILILKIFSDILQVNLEHSCYCLRLLNIFP